jgi:restriction system protein
MPKRRRGAHRGHHPSLSPKANGVALLGLGVLALLLSGAASQHPMLGPLLTAIRALAVGLMGLGLLVLWVARTQERRQHEAAFLPTIAPLQVFSPLEDEEASAAALSPSSAQAQAPKATPGPVATTWSREVFAAIEWRRFEAVCEALFAQAGFQTDSHSHGPDGGVDIWLHSRHADRAVSVVQCKHWRSRPVGVKEVREFFGVMASHGLKRGTYATSSTFTPDALAFAKGNGIHTLDGEGLLALIAQRTPEQQQALLAVAHEGEYWRPTCASCGLKMVERKPREGGAAFWGCPRFPACRRTLAMAAG